MAKRLKKVHDTREAWLRAAVVELKREFFDPEKIKLPRLNKLRVSCGWARGHAKAIGQHFPDSMSIDKSNEIFICPTQDEPTRVLDILLHELIHAATPGAEAHGKDFRRIAKLFGLEGKMTATYVTPGTPLHKRLVEITKRLGKYPHAALQKPERKRGGGMGGWQRYVSVNEDGFKVVVSPKMVEEFGPPRDPWGDEMEPVS